MANVTMGGNISLQFSAAGTRNSDGSQEFSVPAILASLGLDVSTCTVFDQGRFSADQDDLDLTALNLDGTGAKSLDGLYFIMLFVPVAGSGSGVLTISSGTTNPYLGAPLAASGMKLTQNRAFRVLHGDRAVSSTLKTLDIDLDTNPLTWWEYVFAGPNPF